MGARIIWFPEMDQALIELRRKGTPWEAIGERVGVTTLRAKLRAKVLGLPIGRLNVGRISGERAIKLNLISI